MSQNKNFQQMHATRHHVGLMQIAMTVFVPALQIISVMHTKDVDLNVL